MSDESLDGLLAEVRKFAAAHTAAGGIERCIQELTDTVRSREAIAVATQDLRALMRALREGEAVEEQLAALSAQIAESEAMLAIKRQLRDALIAEMRAQGASLRDIAPIAKVSPEMVRRLSEPRSASIRELAEQLGVTVSEALRAALGAGLRPEDWRSPLPPETLRRLRRVDSGSHT